MTDNPLYTSTILVVDDNPHNVGVLFDYLSRFGLTILVAQNGEDALDVVCEKSPDLILLDVLMPGIGGFETCRRLKQMPETRDTPVLFVSSLSETIDKIKGFEAGGVDYITKPFQQEEVLARIKTHLNLKALQRDLQQKNRALQQEIYERENIERALQEAKDQAEAANRAKSEFLANMSHELRTPLNGILGYTQILKRDAQLLPPHVRAINVIHRSGEHLLEMINDILDLSKIEAGKIELEPAPFHLTQSLLTVVEMARIRAEQKQITFTYQAFRDLPVYVAGDEKRLRQVILNLLGNAIKFTEQGEVIFRVTRIQVPGVRRQTGNSQEIGNRNPARKHHSPQALPLESEKVIRFEVEDSGIGIPAEHLKEIFEPFQQVHTRQNLNEGTGLGLAISYRIVQLMGGELRVRSIPQQGSTFWFDLALEEVEQTQDAPASPQPAIVGFTGPSRKIMITDDHDDNRAILREVLEPLGFVLEEATNGQEVLERLLTFHPDLILMDLVMPILDGLETTRRIRNASKFSDVIIIGLSANAFEQMRQESLQIGCNDFLTKPVDIEQLLEKLACHLHLQWRYTDETSPNLNAERSSMRLPAKQDLQILFDAADIGDVVEIRRQLDRLDQLDSQLHAFTSQLRELVKDFQIQQIGNLLKHYLHS